MAETKMARDYRREYDTYHSKPEVMAKRHARDAIRHKMKKYGLVSVGDNRRVSPIDGNPFNSDISNIHIKIKE